MHDAPYETATVASAEALLELLNIRHPDWLPPGRISSPWVFRGHANAAWSLLPSAWRNDARTSAVLDPLREEARRLKRSLPENSRGVSDQFFAENLAVQKFLELADDVGLRIPSEKWHTTVVAGPESPFWPGPHSALRCLAQHHGVPTSLLDWTRNPLTAAFFAALDAEDAGGDEVAVWALRREPAPDGIDIVNAPRGDNSFLHFQEGEFTHDRGGANHYHKHDKWQGREEVVQPGLLRRFVLPLKEVAELRRLLRASRVTPAHLMPEMGAVAEELRHRLRDGHV